MHELIVGQCGEAQCAPVPPGLAAHVYVTKGGDCFHRTPRCGALLDGQSYAERLGMNVHDPARTALPVAQSQGYTACSHCFPAQAAPPRR
ncbi:hypothetical protein [Spirillospora sp. NPDC029432]|uniref:hypothetical protein n=1 Tax=Spirillospora sp. NPDC029432 TaxID=3154599 RepID=UPI003456D8F8